MVNFEHGMLGLKCPANECGKTAGSILLVSDPLQMFDPVGHRFDMTKHHGRARFQTELLCDFHNLEPFVGVAFQRRNPFSNSIDQNLAAATGDRAKAGLLEQSNHIAQRHAECFSEMLKLGWTESVHINMGIFLSNVAQKIEVPFKS